MDSRPTIAEVDLAALRHNYDLVARTIPQGCGILAVVKADAYGHGFMDIARELEALGVTAFGVAFLAEGIQLRKSGIDRPVLILGGVYPGQERKCVGFNLSTALFSLEQARVLDDAAGRLYRRARVHAKIDTGMGRLGIPHEEAQAFFRALRELKHLDLEGIISHFASADELDEDGRRYSDLQAGRFAAAVAAARHEGFEPRYVHIANSAAAFGMDLPFCNLVRPGIVLYGALPSGDFEGKMALKPIMRLRSSIAMLKWVEPGTSISYARRGRAARGRGGDGGGVRARSPGPPPPGGGGGPPGPGPQPPPAASPPLTGDSWPVFRSATPTVTAVPSPTARRLSCAAGALRSWAPSAWTGSWPT